MVDRLTLTFDVVHNNWAKLIIICLTYEIAPACTEFVCLHNYIPKWVDLRNLAFRILARKELVISSENVSGRTIHWLGFVIMLTTMKAWFPKTYRNLFWDQFHVPILALCTLKGKATLYWAPLCRDFGGLTSILEGNIDSLGSGGVVNRGPLFVCWSFLIFFVFYSGQSLLLHFVTLYFSMSSPS